MYIIGAGEHAQVVLSILKKKNQKIEGIFHSKREGTKEWIFDIKITGYFEDFLEDLRDKEVFIAVGDNRLRKEIYEKLKNIGVILKNVIHPTAYIDETSKMGQGIFVGAFAFINTNAKIKDNVIIQSGCIVEHDCVIEEYVFLSVGVRLCGGVYIKKGAFLGAGSVVFEDIKIGNWSIIYGGQVVTKNIDDFSRYFIRCK